MALRAQDAKGAPPLVRSLQMLPAVPFPALRAFRSRNYRLYFAGQGLSLLGTWMQKTAVSWVVYAQTHSKLMLGVSVFATLFPSCVFAPLGGVASDRYNRYRVLLLTQVLSLLQAAALTLVVLRPGFSVWTVIALSVVLGIINAFDTPARQSLVYDLVDDKADLPNALALNSSMVNLSKLIGPGVAGLILEHLGNAVCFGLNTVSFIPVLASLLLMRLPRFEPKAHSKRVLDELAEGFRYIRSTPEIRSIISLFAIASLLVLPFTSLMAVYATDIFRGTASTFGALDSAVGLGAFAGAVYLASLKPGTDLRHILATNTVILGIGLCLFAYTTWYAVALAFIALAAFGMMAQVTVSNTLLQTAVTPEMRGRVISVFVMAYSGALPLGSLLVTAVSHRIGVQNTVLGEGIFALLLGAFHLRHLRRRHAETAPMPMPEAEADLPC